MKHFKVIAPILIGIFLIGITVANVKAYPENTCSSTSLCESTATPKPTSIPSTAVPPTQIVPTVPQSTATPLNTTVPKPHPKKTPVPKNVVTPQPTISCMTECEFRDEVIDLLTRILIELQKLSSK